MKKSLFDVNLRIRQTDLQVHKMRRTLHERELLAKSFGGGQTSSRFSELKSQQVTRASEMQPTTKATTSVEDAERMYQSEFSRSTNRMDNSYSGASRGAYVPQETIIENNTTVEEQEETDTYGGSGGLSKLSKRPSSTSDAKRREAKMKATSQQSGGCCSGGNECLLF